MAVTTSPGQSGMFSARGVGSAAGARGLDACGCPPRLRGRRFHGAAPCRVGRRGHPARHVAAIGVVLRTELPAQRRLLIHRDEKMEQERDAGRVEQDAGAAEEQPLAEQQRHHRHIPGIADIPEASADHQMTGRRDRCGVPRPSRAKRITKSMKTGAAARQQAPCRASASMASRKTAARCVQCDSRKGTYPTTVPGTTSTNTIVPIAGHHKGSLLRAAWTIPDNIGYPAPTLQAVSARNLYQRGGARLPRHLP